jgi:transketolase
MSKISKNLIKSSIDRCNNYRKRILQLSQRVGALHIGGSFSSVEILDFIFNFLKKKKDKFILSKGHCGILQYVILEQQKIISKKFLESYCQKNSKLGVHPDYGNPGIEASTGSLGHGLGIASGLAIGLNKKKQIFVVISDGELMEGTTWEYLLMISSLKINNINLFIDYNGLQSSTFSKDTHPTLHPIKEKLKAFGWTADYCNGHDVNEMLNKFKLKKKTKPFALVCRTIKGYPIKFMMNVPMWHYRSPNKQEYLEAIKILDNCEKKSYEK